MSDDLASLKAIQRAIWSAGDPDAVAELFWDVGAVVAQDAAIEPGMRVLDVATGTGNAAIRAAQAGAAVVGLDLTPELFADARRREALAGVHVEWVEGDAESLPFEDASFDRVLSTFGVMYAPRHAVAAAELVRTCRPGGMIVLANWTPDGFVGRMFALFARYLPPSPGASAPPTAWGDEAHLRALLGGQILLAMERRCVDLVGAGVDEMMRDHEARFGPLILARRMLEPARYGALVGELRALVEQAAAASDGAGAGAGAGDALRIPAEYLLVVGLKP